MAREGAKHLYLLDFSDQVATFAKGLQADFPDTKVIFLKHTKTLIPADEAGHACSGRRSIS
jgi:hypothetical protein